MLLCCSSVPMVTDERSDIILNSYSFLVITVRVFSLFFKALQQSAWGFAIIFLSALVLTSGTFWSLFLQMAALLFSLDLSYVLSIRISGSVFHVFFSLCTFIFMCCVLRECLRFFLLIFH